MAEKGWVDFKAVKAAVSMEMALTHYGVQLRRVNKTSLRGVCPSPIHPEGTNNNTFGVSTEKNPWACQVPTCVASKIGRKGGNVLDFVAMMEDCSIREAALSLQNWFNVEATAQRDADVAGAEAGESTAELATRKEGAEGEDLQQEPVNPPLEFELQRINSSHAYLTQRGITQATAEHFGVGFFSGKGSMKGRVVIPIHDERAELVAYAGRAIDDAEPKYKLPSGFRKSLVLFNAHQAMKGGRGVVVVEGFFDAMKVHQAGLPCVVSVMGATLSAHQETLVLEHFDSVVLMLDGDETGRAAAAEISARLMSKTFVRVVDVPMESQPDQLSSEEIGELLAFLRSPA